LGGEIPIINRAPDGVQIICNGLQFACIGGDGHITSWSAAESFAEEEVPRGLIGEEEAM
jgi:hypothetical protein